MNADQYFYNGINQALGFRFASGATSVLTVSAQTMALSAATNFVWKAGRCYEIVLRGRMSTNTAGALAIFKLLRGTTTAASVAIDFGGFKCGAVGDVLPLAIPPALIGNSTGADITQTVQMSLQSNGAPTVSWDGATMPRSLVIRDIGATSDYTGCFNSI